MSSLSQSTLRTTNGRQRLVPRKEDDGHEGHCDRELEFLTGADLRLGQGYLYVYVYIYIYIYSMYVCIYIYIYIYI